MKAAVLGATGYTGLVLLRLLGRHPDVRGIIAVSSSQPGEPVRAIDPGLSAEVEAKMAGSGGKLSPLSDAVKAAESGDLDVVFSGLPHLKSAEICGPFFGRCVVIDLSADFRFGDAAAFQKAYGSPPPRPDLLSKAVFGLAEWHGDTVRTADIIANPGCYPTCTLLPLLPLAREGLLTGAVIVNAISGISGAGKKERMDLLYCERTENACAYNPGTSHRHAPEIAKELQAAAAGLSLLFTPHLAPLKRGMCATTAVQLTRVPDETGPNSIRGIYEKYYGGRPFISLAGSRIPQTRDVWGSNRCDMGWQREGGSLLLFSAIDNLMKGASGQAVQNMNIRFGLEEAAGLPAGGEL
jgi:N-acetyl-gamma-glutamyl-phosphate reductase